MIEEEALGFLGNYWGERGVLQRIFDPRGWDFYQARELSYAVDFLDAQWVRLLLSHGVLFFVPPSALLAALAIVPIGRWVAPRATPWLAPPARWLVLLVFLSSFGLASTTGMLYRATKPLVAPLLLALLLVTLAELREPRLRPPIAFSAVFAAGLAMSLLDRQGLFYLLLLVAALAVAALRFGRGRPLLAGGAAAATAWAAYNWILGPWIIHALNGYWPTMRFQRLRPSRLLDLQPWREGGRLLGDWASVFAGGVPARLLALAAALGLLAWLWRSRVRSRRAAAVVAAAIVFGAAQLGMTAVMVDRHEPVTWVDHRFWYYPLPFHAVLVFGALWGLDAWSRRGALPRLVLAGLGALVLSNLAQWPERRLVMESGPWFADVSRRSALLVRSLGEGGACPLLDGDYRRFYFDALDRFPVLAARSRAQAGEATGFAVARLEQGRPVARGERHASLVVRAVQAGPHVLAGRVRLADADSLQVLLGSAPARLLAEVGPAGAPHDPLAFRVRAELAAGPNEVRLMTRGDGFTLLLPVAVWRE